MILLKESIKINLLWQVSIKDTKMDKEPLIDWLACSWDGKRL